MSTDTSNDNTFEEQGVLNFRGPSGFAQMEIDRLTEGDQPFRNHNSTVRPSSQTLLKQITEPQLKGSLNWFNQWEITGSCSEATLKKWTAKLQSPISKGFGFAIGIAIGVGVVMYAYSNTIKIPRIGSPPAPIEAPRQTK
jgi:hypothetical protein